MANNTSTLGDIDTAVQDELRNSVGTPLTSEKRVRAYNRVLDWLQGKANWNTTKRVKQFEYLSDETDYSIVNTLSITDFKDIWDLRMVDDSDNRHIEEYTDIGEKKFSLFKGQNKLTNKITVEERDNDKILRILSIITKGRTVVHQMDSLTANGTWASNTTTSDAQTLAADTTKKKEGSASLKFNISVSQSGNNYAEIATTTTSTTSVDGTDLENIGHFRLWLGLHNMSAANPALITGVTLRWGSDSSNYWEITPTTTITGGSFKAEWNRLDFNWGSATKTGTPDVSALDYFLIRLTYSSGMTDTNNIRIDELVLLKPIDMELVYFSNNFVTSSAGVQQARFTESTVDTTEILLLPERHLETFVRLAMTRLVPQKQRNNDDYIRYTRESEEAYQNMLNDIGNEIVREQENLRIEGTASGRQDVYNRQW